MSMLCTLFLTPNRHNPISRGTAREEVPLPVATVRTRLVVPAIRLQVKGYGIADCFHRMLMGVRSEVWLLFARPFSVDFETARGASSSADADAPSNWCTTNTLLQENSCCGSPWRYVYSPNPPNLKAGDQVISVIVDLPPSFGTGNGTGLSVSVDIAL